MDEQDHGIFFFQNQSAFSSFQKGAGETSPLQRTSCAPGELTRAKINLM